MSEAQKRMYALGRLKPGQMNKTEAAYAQLLELRRRAGEVEWYMFEGCKFRLAGKTFYTPDFMVMLANGQLEAHEVKGFWKDDARVKIKCAAEGFPIRFKAVKKVRGVGTLKNFDGRGGVMEIVKIVLIVSVCSMVAGF